MLVKMTKVVADEWNTSPYPNSIDSVTMKRGYDVEKNMTAYIIYSYRYIIKRHIFTYAFMSNLLKWAHD